MTTTQPHAPTRHHQARPIGAIIALATGAVTVVTAAGGRIAGGQDCRLEYHRAGASATQQLTLASDAVQEFPVGVTATALANRGSAPLSLALVGAPIAGVPATPGGTIPKVLGGLSGGVVNDRGGGPSAYGGAYGGVLKGAADHVATLGGSWITLQPGQRLDGLRHDLAAVACGADNPIARAISAASASR